MADHIVSRDEKDIDAEKNTATVTSSEPGTPDRRKINASGHVDQLDRQYGLLSICATALTVVLPGVVIYHLLSREY
ncbi:hypothetical protein C8R47DRAFT_1312550 [Mycena vitilis]|nr:hypothetical protein C8R47DRAFT_1312550 [Mycena vitilis]